MKTAISSRVQSRSASRCSQKISDLPDQRARPKPLPIHGRGFFFAGVCEMSVVQGEYLCIALVDPGFRAGI